MTARGWALLGIVGIALALRIFAVFELLPEKERVPTHDAKLYNLLAASLVEGRGFAWPTGGNQHSVYPLPEGPTSYRAPLYPAFLASIYRVFGVGNYTAARLAQYVVGVLLCLVIYRIGTLWGSPRLGLLAALIAAVYPPCTHFSYYGGPGRLLTEGLFMLLMTMAIWQPLRLTQDITRWQAAVMGGILLGLAMLTRPVPTLFPAVTLRSLRRLLANHRFRIVSVRVTPIPFEAAWPSATASVWVRLLTTVSYGLARLWKTLFAYQFIVIAEPLPTPGIMEPITLRAEEHQRAVPAASAS